jgi:hypothetical protein
MVERALLVADEHGFESPVQRGDTAWDVIVYFAPGVIWEDPFPVPTWYGDDVVVRSLGPVEGQLKAAP